MDHATGHDFTYRQYPQRWRMLLIVFFANLVTQSIFITFAPIATPAAIYYTVDLTAINWLALIWPALFLPGTIFAAWSFFKFGLRKNMLMAGGMMALGTGVRLISLAVPIEKQVEELNLEAKNSRMAYTFVLLGSMIVASVQPIVLSATTQIAAAWFSEASRGQANTMMALGHPLGLAIGALIPPAMVDHTDGVGIDRLLLLQFALALLVALSCLLLQAAPPTAPSATAPYRRGNDNLGRDLKSLKANFGFMTLCNIWALTVGTLQAFLTLLQQILSSKGYTPADAGYISATLIVCGIAGAAIAGPLVDMTRAYKYILAGSITLAFPFMVLLAIASQRTNRLEVLYICAALLGFLGYPVLPVALDMSAEITYPIPGGLTSAILWCASQVTAMILVILIDGPLKEDLNDDGPGSLQVGVWLLVGCIAAATFLSWLWSGRYVRHEAEQTVTRLRQAQRRDMGQPFVAAVVDTPMAPTPQGHEVPGNHMPNMRPMETGLPERSNAAVVEYVARSQAIVNNENDEGYSESLPLARAGPR